MDLILLISSVFLSASSAVLGKFYNRKNSGKRDPNRIYTLLQLAAVFVLWCILYLTEFTFEAAVLPYALVFGGSFALTNISIINALKHGPAALTSLFTSMSMVLVTIWGLLFWNAPVTPVVIAGLVLVVLSIVLCIYNGKQNERKVSVKWLIFATLSMIGNAACSISQRTEQMVFHGEHGKMLMAFATLLSTAAAFVIYLTGDRSDTKPILRKTWFLPVLSGVLNVGLNLFVMLLVQSELSPSLIYPVIGVGGLSVVMIFSQLVFREKLKYWQWIGIALGAAATVLLSI